MSSKWSVRENIRNIFGSTQLNFKSSLSPSTSQFRGLESLFIISRESRVLLPVRPGRFWPRHINLEAGMTEICWLFPHYWWWRSVCQYKLLTIIQVFYGGPVPPQDTKIDDSGKFGKQYCIRREKYNCYLILMRWEVLLNIITAILWFWRIYWFVAVVYWCQYNLYCIKNDVVFSGIVGAQALWLAAVITTIIPAQTCVT